jgi:hypothetical protein
LSSNPAIFTQKAPGWAILPSHLKETSKNPEKTIATNSEGLNTNEQQISVIEHVNPLNSIKEVNNMAPTAGEKDLLVEERQAKERDWSLAQTDLATCSDPLSIRSAILPTLKITLHEALFIELPFCSSPLDYINAEASYIKNVVQQLLALTQHGEFCHVVFTGSMIYHVSFIS